MVWNVDDGTGQTLLSGLYLLRLSVGGQSTENKVLLLKELPVNRFEAFAQYL